MTTLKSGPMGGPMSDFKEKEEVSYDEASVPLKSLPKSLQPYYSMEKIRDPNIPVEDKVSLVKIYGKNSKEWVIPRSSNAREFAIDMILHQLTDAQNLKVGTFVNLHDKAIRWVIKEAQEILKKEPSLLEIEGPVRVTGDFHG